jgi:hypothetical protein
MSPNSEDSSSINSRRLENPGMQSFRLWTVFSSELIERMWSFPQLSREAFTYHSVVSLVEKRSNPAAFKFSLAGGEINPGWNS